MRLFIAAAVPASIRERLEPLGRELEGEVTVVKKENMHISLRFIWEIDNDKVAGLREHLRGVKFNKFDCSLSGVGVFPSAARARVVWVGVESGGALEMLAGEIDKITGFGKRDEKFSAHMTIARIRKRISIDGFLEKHDGEQFGRFTVDSFDLIQSTLTPKGPIYTVLEKFNGRKKE